MRDTEHPFVRDLRPADAQALVAAAHRSNVPAGSTVFSIGDLPDAFYLVLDGRLASRAMTPAGDVNTFAIIGPGESFGEMALLGAGARRSSTVIALEPVRLLVLPAPAFTALRRAVPAVDDALLAVLAERVRRLSDHLIEALHVPVEQRVVRRLIVLCRAYSTDLTDDVTVPVTQADLASLAGTSRQTVNRVLRSLERDGLVALHRSAVTVAQPRRLAPFAR